MGRIGCGDTMNESRSGFGRKGIGFINAAVVQGLGINAFIVTLATMTALRGILLIITGGHTASADDREALAPLKWIENGVWTPPNLFWCGGAAALIAAALLWWRRRAETPLIWAGAGLVLVVAGFFFDATWPLAKPVYYMAAVTAGGGGVTRFTIIGRRLRRSAPIPKQPGSLASASTAIGSCHSCSMDSQPRSLDFCSPRGWARCCRTPCRGWSSRSSRLRSSAAPRCSAVREVY